MAQRLDPRRILVETGFPAALFLDIGRREGRTGRPAEGCRARAHGVRRATRHLGEWRPGFLHDPALRCPGLVAAAEDVLGFVCGPQFRREPLLPPDGAALRYRPSRIRP